MFGQRSALATAVSSRVALVRPSSRGSRLVTEAKITSSGEHVVTLRANWNRKYPVRRDGEPLSQYLNGGDKFIDQFSLPLGASLTPMAAANHFQLAVPKLQFMDVFIKPTADCVVTTEVGQVTINTIDCVIEGSQQVKDLGLEERYDVDVNVVISSVNDAELSANADLMLRVDLPFPFSLTPKAVFETGGNVVVNGLMNALMDPFMASVVRDFEVWSADEAVRMSRV